MEKQIKSQWEIDYHYSNRMNADECVKYVAMGWRIKQEARESLETAAMSYLNANMSQHALACQLIAKEC